MDNRETLIASRMRPCKSMPRHADPTKERKRRAHNASNRTYYQRHKEEVSEKNRRWYERNKERKKAYYEAHKEHIRAYHKEWYKRQKAK